MRSVADAVRLLERRELRVRSVELDAPLGCGHSTRLSSSLGPLRATRPASVRCVSLPGAEKLSETRVPTSIDSGECELHPPRTDVATHGLSVVSDAASTLTGKYQSRRSLGTAILGSIPTEPCVRIQPTTGRAQTSRTKCAGSRNVELPWNPSPTHATSDAGHDDGTTKLVARATTAGHAAPPGDPGASPRPAGASPPRRFGHRTPAAAERRSRG